MTRLLGLLPTRLVSRCIGFLARVRRPAWFKNLLIRSLVRIYRIDTSQVEQEPCAYPSLQDFFIRRLKPGARPVASGADEVASPVDARLVTHGRLTDGRQIEVKGSLYTAAELVGDDEAAAPFRDGSFMVFHLRPFDYHRIHTPVAGKVTGHAFIEGRLLPVHEPGLRVFARVYARNRRRTTILEGPFGVCAVVKVGAFNVGAIPVEYDVPAGTGYTPVTDGRSFARGEELGRFEMGSTVVLLAKGIRFDDFKPDTEVRCGQRIGTLMKPVMSNE